MTRVCTPHPISASVSNASRILYDLVATPSVSGNELHAARIFVEHATRLGFESHIDVVHNAIAHRGSAQEHASVHIVLLGHIDTVPGDIPVRIEDGILHGRGSVDAKGPLTAMLVAASRALIPDGVRLTVAGAAGEEASGSVGARHLVGQWSPDACIIGEPSASDGVTLGYKGRLLANASASCPNTHSAGKDTTASDRLHKWWSSVLDHMNSLNTDQVGAFNQVQASLLAMDSSDDGLEQHAKLRAGFRLPPTVTPDELSERLQSCLSVDIELTFDGAELAHSTDRNDRVVRALSNAIRSRGHQPRPKLKTGTSDMNVVAPIWRCPIAAYGPGDSSLDHTPTEHLVLSELDESVEILIVAIEQLIASLL